MTLQMNYRTTDRILYANHVEANTDLRLVITRWVCVSLASRRSEEGLLAISKRFLPSPYTLAKTHSYVLTCTHDA